MPLTFDYATGEVKVVKQKTYSDGERANVRFYGADDVREGVAIMHSDALMHSSQAHLQFQLTLR